MGRFPWDSYRNDIPMDKPAKSQQRELPLLMQNRNEDQLLSIMASLYLHIVAAGFRFKLAELELDDSPGWRCESPFALVASRVRPWVTGRVEVFYSSISDEIIETTWTLFTRSQKQNTTKNALSTLAVFNVASRSYVAITLAPHLHATWKPRQISDEKYNTRNRPKNKINH